MSRFDAHTIQSGTSALKLMKRAGKVLTERIISTIKSKSQILILCGPGNNGGDGYVIGHLLKNANHDVTIIEIAPSTDESPERSAVKEEYVKGGGKIDQSFDSRKQSDVIVDALLGNGQRGALCKNVVDLFNSTLGCNKGALRIAIDVPTGVDPTTGSADESTFKADKTLAIQCIKRGLTQLPAQRFCGEIEVVPIGINIDESVTFTLLDSTTRPKLKALEVGAHKGTFGHTVIIGGSRQMPGAPILSASAALSSGVGRVTVVKPKGVPFFSNSPPEIMWKETGCDTDYHHKSNHFDELAQLISDATTLIIGPGLGKDPDSIKLVKLVLTETESDKAIVLDADALLLPLLKNVKARNNLVLTPHPGEAARLLKSETKAVQADRFSALRSLTEAFNGDILLKGHGSLIAVDEQRFVCSTGSEKLATAGSGDVLCGIIAGLHKRTDTFKDALLLGVYLHGLVGDILKEKGNAPATASDIIKTLPEAFEHL